MLTEGIWDRTGTDTMTESTYIRAVALFTLMEAVLVACGTFTSYNSAPSLLLILGSFAVSIVCIFVFQMSDGPIISALGVGIMSYMLGLMIGPVVAMYTAQAVMLAIITTAGTMGVMSVVGIMFPGTFRGWGPYLMGGLTLLIVAQFAQLFLIGMGVQGSDNMPLLTWAGVILFIGIVAFDWSRALDLPHTLNNAIDASGGLILDAVNLFIRFLQIFGGKGSRR